MKSAHIRMNCLLGFRFVFRFFSCRFEEAASFYTLRPDHFTFGKGENPPLFLIMHFSRMGSCAVLKFFLIRFVFPILFIFPLYMECYKERLESTETRRFRRHFSQVSSVS